MRHDIIKYPYFHLPLSIVHRSIVTASVISVIAKLLTVDCRLPSMVPQIEVPMQLAKTPLTQTSFYIESSIVHHYFRPSPFFL